MTKVSRDKIILAARELFRTRGYAGASMAELAEAVGLKKASLYSHFNTKEDLVPEALELTLAELSDLPSRTGEAREDYRAALRHVVDYLSRGKRCVGVHLLYGISEGVPRQSVLSFFRRMTSFFARILRKELPGDVAREFAEDTIVALEGATVWLALRNDAAPILRAEAQLMQRLDRLLESHAPALQPLP